MIRDWRSLIPWRRKEAQPMPPDDRKPAQGKQEPTFARDERVDRMEFLLSLRRRGISDAAVLRAMDAVPREAFVLPAFAATAYADQAMPIACGQTISQPYVVAYMTEQLEVKRDHRVLEVGTGSGYQAAILSRLAARVVSIERVGRLAAAARQALDLLGVTNVVVYLGDGSLGRPADAPFDAIVVAAGGPQVPRPLLAQLRAGGRLVGPFGGRKEQRLVRVERRSDGSFHREVIGRCRFVDLLGAHGWAA